jgi:hypothetical protein
VIKSITVQPEKFAKALHFVWGGKPKMFPLLMKEGVKGVVGTTEKLQPPLPSPP